MSYYNFLISGTKGMRKAVWKKFENREDFGAAFKEVTRPMHDWEVALLQINIEDCDKLNVNPTQLINDTIGKRLIKKYWIELN